MYKLKPAPNARTKMIGRRFGKLTVAAVAGRGGPQSRLFFRCECDCGETVPAVEGCSLYNRKSCGCNMARDPGEVAFHQLWTHYRKGARSRGISWDLTKEQFRALTVRHCQYCGTPPSKVISPVHITDEYTYSGVDRVRNAGGYTPDNCAPCCERCNRAKGQLSADEFVEMCRLVAGRSDA